MQKVVGSSPIIRSSRPAGNGGFLRSHRAFDRALHPSVVTAEVTARSSTASWTTTRGGRWSCCSPTGDEAGLVADRWNRHESDRAGELRVELLEEPVSTRDCAPTCSPPSKEEEFPVLESLGSGPMSGPVPPTLPWDRTSVGKYWPFRAAARLTLIKAPVCGAIELGPAVSVFRKLAEADCGAATNSAYRFLKAGAELGRVHGGPTFHNDGELVASEP